MVGPEIGVSPLEQIKDLLQSAQPHRRVGRRHLPLVHHVDTAVDLAAQDGLEGLGRGQISVDLQQAVDAPGQGCQPIHSGPGAGGHPERPVLQGDGRRRAPLLLLQVEAHPSVIQAVNPQQSENLRAKYTFVRAGSLKIRHSFRRQFHHHDVSSQQYFVLLVPSPIKAALRTAGAAACAIPGAHAVPSAHAGSGTGSGRCLPESTGAHPPPA